MKRLLALFGFARATRANPDTRRYRRDMTTSDMLVVDTDTGPIQFRVEKLTATKAVINVLHPLGMNVRAT